MKIHQAEPQNLSHQPPPTSQSLCVDKL